MNLYTYKAVGCFFGAMEMDKLKIRDVFQDTTNKSDWRAIFVLNKSYDNLLIKKFKRYYTIFTTVKNCSFGFFRPEKLWALFSRIVSSNIFTEED